MGKTAQQLIIDAYLQSGMIPQENGNVPAYMIDQGLTLLNDIIAMWGSDTSMIPYQDIVTFTMEQNKSSYTFGLGDQYDVKTSPILDITTLTYTINTGENIKLSTTTITEPQYANIVYTGISTYPCEVLLRPLPEYSEVIVQPPPFQDFPATMVCKQRTKIVSLFQDLGCQFPPGYLLCLKYQLMLDIADAFSFVMPNTFIMKAQQAISQMRGNNKLDLSLQKSETLMRRRFSLFPFATGGIY